MTRNAAKGRKKHLFQIQLSSARRGVSSNLPSKKDNPRSTSLPRYQLIAPKS